MLSETELSQLCLTAGVTTRLCSPSEAAKFRDEVKTSHRMMVRERMACKDFKWYLDNIWPEHFFPDDDRFFGKVSDTAFFQHLGFSRAL